MRVSYEWLGDFVDLAGVTPEAAAEKLTMAGVEVAQVRVVDLREIVVGRVISQAAHPQSNKPLWVHQVDLGGRTEQIIAGAPNAVPGSLVPVALPGTTVPNGRYVRDAVIAGVAGRGMLCSEVELELGGSGNGIMLLDQGHPGQSLAELFPMEAVFEVEVTPNRPDCLGHLGIARELAAVLGRPLLRDFMPPFTGGIEPPGTELVRVTIEEPELCRRYIGAVVADVEVAPSPARIQRRLRAAGVRPINNVVDITNYVLLEYGQPLHAFDLDRLSGPEIRVRRARPGESLLCLDGVMRSLTEEMLVIADAERPVALAGVIGGEESAVSERSTRVLLEAATFNGPNVRATSRAFNLRTEASSRFEKTLSPELALAGARRAVELLQDIARGRVHREWPDVYPAPQEPVRIGMAPSHVDAVLGVHVPLEESESILQRLGFHVRVQQDGMWDVLPPVFRLDVSLPEDVVEEVGRIHGYDKVPARLPGRERDSWVAAPVIDPVGHVRDVLVGAGFTEIITPALVSTRLFARLQVGEGMLRILNPLSDELDGLRTTLLPQLIQTASSNVNHGSREPSLFEVGRVFVDRDGTSSQPDEPGRLAAFLPAGGDASEGRAAFLALKSVLDRIAADLGLDRLVYRPRPARLFHPGRCAEIVAGERSIGTLGELHPEVLRLLDVPGRAAALEVDLDALVQLSSARRARQVPRFPAVDRDLSIEVAGEVPAASLEATIRTSGGDLLESATAWDEYRGPQLGEGVKSVSFALTFRSPDRTLTHAEVESAMARIRASLEREHSGRVRGAGT